MLAEIMSAVVQVQEKDTPTVLFLLWGAVVVGGLLGLGLMSAGSNSMNPAMHNAGRLIGRIALIAILPAVTLTCSAAGN